MYWAPSLSLGHNKLGTGKGESAQERDERAQSRKRRRQEADQRRQDEIQVTVNTDNADQEQDEQSKSSCSKEPQTEQMGDLVIDLFDEDDFTSDDEKVKYYTGLPSRELRREVFKLVVPFPGTKRMYYWQSFIATMMKLRLNLRLQDLTYRLRLSLSTMLRRYHEMLQILYVRLKFLIM